MEGTKEKTWGKIGKIITRLTIGLSKTDIKYPYFNNSPRTSFYLFRQPFFQQTYFATCSLSIYAFVIPFFFTIFISQNLRIYFRSSFLGHSNLFSSFQRYFWSHCTFFNPHSFGYLIIFNLSRTMLSKGSKKSSNKPSLDSYVNWFFLGF
jgi:hypothetical protein